jgi:hypothetical protein
MKNKMRIKALSVIAGCCDVATRSMRAATVTVISGKLPRAGGPGASTRKNYKKFNQLAE